MEQTLSIVKPDAVSAGHAWAILDRIERSGLRIAAVRKLRLSEAQARAFYAVHSERPFYQSLVKFMTSGEVVVSVLAGAAAIVTYRELMGATNPEEAAPGTLRKEFATDIERNAVHGSDAPETAAQEIAFFFAATDIS